MTIFGSRDIWAIEVEPLAGPPHEPDSAAAATWTALQIWAGGQNLTAHTRIESMTASAAVYWPAAFLARWFVNVWDDLWSRSGWPLRGTIVDPYVACARLDAFLAAHDVDIDDEFLERRDAFVASHTLLAASGGGVMPHLYLMREGRHVHAAWNDPQTPAAPVTFHSRSGLARIEAPFFLEAVSAFVDWCGKQVSGQAPEFSRAVALWLEGLRGENGATSVLRGYVHPWAARNGAATLQELKGVLELPPGWAAEGALLDVERIPAAIVYRSLAPVLEAADVAVLLELLRSCLARPEGAAKLEQMSAGLSLLSSDPPHVQGYQLAEQVRARHGNLDTRLDIEGFFSELRIEVRKEDLSNESVDAATIWDATHGPVVILNERARRDVPWARRMSLAHELCHLLVDRGKAAAVMIASTPWAPPEIERRANAFAAELLLPRLGIVRTLAEKLRQGWIDEQDRETLMNEFGVGDTVCRHQLENRLGMPGDS